MQSVGKLKRQEMGLLFLAEHPSLAGCNDRDVQPVAFGCAESPVENSRREERQSRRSSLQILHHRISLLDRCEERTCTNTLYIIEYNEVQDSRRKALNESMP
jgi:hypothetical protein